MPKHEHTSAKIASIAARGMRAPLSLSPDEIQSVCASVVTQAPDKKPLLTRLKEKLL